MRAIVTSAAQVGAYAPANHTGTSNVRVIGPETVGAKALEILIGTIRKSHGAQPHAHPFLEQCGCILEGTGETEAEGRALASGPGSWSYLPSGLFHEFRVTSDTGRVLVVYAPPYLERAAQTITQPDPAVLPAGKMHVSEVAASDARAVVPLIDAERCGARWVEVAALRLAPGAALACSARSDAEQVVFLQHGEVAAHVDGEVLPLAAGDFLFLPPGTPCELGGIGPARASGFLIAGRFEAAASTREAS